MSSRASIPVIGAKAGTVVEVVPGRRFIPMTIDSIDPIAVMEIVPAGEGTFRPVVRICGRWWSCSTKNLRRLGIGISPQGLLRLIRAGFVLGRNITPLVTQFDYHSYMAHEAATADPEFWEKTEPGHKITNRQRFRASL